MAHKTESKKMSTKKDVEGLILSELWDLCYRAHSYTSFSPEKRATSCVKQYSQMLEEDLKELGDKQGNYKEKFIAKFSEWMRAKSNCISSMITGGSNFPVRKARKANNAERNKCDAFYLWREKYFKAVNRVPIKSPEEELDIAERRLELLLNNQAEYKEINAEIRKCKIQDHYELLKYLKEMGYDYDALKLIEQRGGKYKIPAFILTNNNATIKRTSQKVIVMTNRIERKSNWEDITFDGGYATIADDRVKIFHDEKPSKEIITEIKSNGFRWSPHWKCWCRKHTGNAIYALKQLSFINNTGL
jgi:hypothetical protein